MVSKFNGKVPDPKKGATKPTGQSAKQPVKVVKSEYTKAKEAGGAALLGGTIGNTP